jgi:WD40 repeat protein
VYSLLSRRLALDNYSKTTESTDKDVVVAGGEGEGAGVEVALASLQLNDDNHDTEEQQQQHPSQEKLPDQETLSPNSRQLEHEQETPSPHPVVAVVPETTDHTTSKELDWNNNNDNNSHDFYLEPNPIQSASYSYDEQQQQQSQNESLAVFTDEELVAALINFDVNDDDNDDNSHEDTSGGQFGGSDLLPEIQVDFDDDLDDFLAPDQLDSVFDIYNENNEAEDSSPADDNNDKNNNNRIPRDPSDATTTHNNETIESTRTPTLLPQDQDQDQYDSSHQLELELANLSLGEYDDWNPEIPDDWDIIGGTDGLPPYMYCQPCEIQPGDFEQLYQVLPPIEEDEPLSDQKARLERQSIEQERPDLEDLPSLDLLNLGTTQDEQEFSQGMDNPELEERHETPADPIRKQAIEAAKPFWEAFGLGDEKSKERTCLGHKETIFGLSFSQDGNYCATASQDSTVHVWDVEKNVRVSALTEHSTDYECLRATWASSEWSSEILDRSQGDTKHLLASGGADGIVKLWGCQDPKKGNWKCHATLDHSKLGKRGEEQKKQQQQQQKQQGDTEEKEDKPQVYATAFIDHWKAFTTTEESSTTTRNSFLMTSSDDYIHFWEIEATPSDQQIQLLDRDVRVLQTDTISLKEVMSLHFGELDEYGYGVTVCSVTGSGLQLPPTHKPEPRDDDGYGDQGPADGHPTPFGGERNPNNMIFVFDATYCPANGLLGVALSDGSLRLVNGRGVCVSIINLPGCQSHLTSFCWDSTGTRLATCVATGHLIAWDLDISEADSGIAATCKAIMEGGK